MPKINVVLLGLDKSGKSTALQTILQQTPTSTNTLQDPPPSFTFEKHSQKLKRYWMIDCGCFMLLKTLFVDYYDISGTEEYRKIWKDYYSDAHACIYFIDATDSPARLEESVRQLSLCCGDIRMLGKPVLVVVNECNSQKDAAGNHSSNSKEEMIRERFERVVQMINHGDPVGVVSSEQHRPLLTISNTGPNNREALKEGMKWLLGKVEKDYENLQKRVVKDTQIQKAEWKSQRDKNMQTIMKTSGLDVRSSKTIYPDPE